ncbi:MAG: hypothetical protein Q8909_10505 [Bacteroidota bacterium]|nr:hypothetical protein [Bacteroidota bacterium]
MLFDENWKFWLQDTTGAENSQSLDAIWITLDLPPDWSIVAKINSKNPTGSADYFKTYVD